MNVFCLYEAKNLAIYEHIVRNNFAFDGAIFADGDGNTAHIAVYRAVKVNHPIADDVTQNIHILSNNGGNSLPFYMMGKLRVVSRFIPQ